MTRSVWIGRRSYLLQGKMVYDQHKINKGDLRVSSEEINSTAESVVIDRSAEELQKIKPCSSLP